MVFRCLDAAHSDTKGTLLVKPNCQDSFEKRGSSWESRQWQEGTIIGGTLAALVGSNVKKSSIEYVRTVVIVIKHLQVTIKSSTTGGAATYHPSNGSSRTIRSNSSIISSKSTTISTKSISSSVAVLLVMTNNSDRSSTNSSRISAQTVALVAAALHAVAVQLYE